MTLRFYRRIPIVPGLRLNLSKRGASVSVGRRGLWWTIGTRGRRATVGMPGTGIFWTERSSAVHAGHQGAFVVGLLIGLALFLLATGLAHADNVYADCARNYAIPAMGNQQEWLARDSLCAELGREQFRREQRYENERLRRMR